MKTSRFLLAAALALIPVQTAAQPRVVDGDTIVMNGTTYRLWGIDAPELKQACPDGWPAGVESAAFLRFVLNRAKKVECEVKTKDHYGRSVALCRADGQDIQSIMVTLGYAWAFTRYSKDYELQDMIAKTIKWGVHEHRCLPAWEWRADNTRRVGE